MKNPMSMDTTIEQVFNREETLFSTSKLLIFVNYRSNFFFSGNISYFFVKLVNKNYTSNHICLNARDI